MIKVKILGVSKFFNSSETSFDFILKENRVKDVGVITINNEEKIVNVLPFTFTYGQKHKRIAILKEVFYSFCLKRYKNKSKKFKNVDPMEEYVYADKQINRYKV